MLTKNHILQILNSQKQNLTHHGVKEIGLFGSYIDNSQHENSDIDILIDFHKKKETFDNLMRAIEIIEALFPKNKVEIITKNGLSKHIGSYILKQTVYA